MVPNPQPIVQRRDREATPEENERDRLLMLPVRELVDEIDRLREENARLDAGADANLRELAEWHEKVIGQESEINRLRELTERQQGFIDKFQDWGYSMEPSDAHYGG